MCFVINLYIDLKFVEYDMIFFVIFVNNLMDIKKLKFLRFVINVI